VSTVRRCWTERRRRRLREGVRFYVGCTKGGAGVRWSNERAIIHDRVRKGDVLKPSGAEEPRELSFNCAACCMCSDDGVSLSSPIAPSSSTFIQMASHRTSSFRIASLPKRSPMDVSLFKSEEERGISSQTRAVSTCSNVHCALTRHIVRQRPYYSLIWCIYSSSLFSLSSIEVQISTPQKQQEQITSNKRCHNP